MISKNALFLILKEENFFCLSQRKCKERLCKYIFQKFKIQENFQNVEKCVNNKLKVFISKFTSKWKSCRQMCNKFVNKNSKSLESKLCLLIPTLILKQTSPKAQYKTKKYFSDISEKSKNREISVLLFIMKVIFAARKSVWKICKKNASEIL